MNSIDRAQLIKELEQISSATLDRAHKGSHGRGALFLENFCVASSVLYGDGSYMTRSGHTALEYATRKGRAMGCTPKEWAGWIINQNRIHVGPLDEADDLYLAIAYRDRATFTQEQYDECVAAFARVQ